MKNFKTELEFLSITIILFILYLIYLTIDPLQNYYNDIQIWDSFHYRDLSEQIIKNGFNNLSQLKPFCYRILHPAITTMIINGLGLTYAQSSHFLNVFCTFLITLFSYYYWVNFGISKKISLIGVLVISVLWIGPLRVSIYFPSGQFPFEILLTFLTYFAVKNLIHSENIKNKILYSSLLFFTSLGKEIVFYILILIIIFAFIIKNRKVLNKFKVIFFYALIPSFIGTYLPKFLIHGYGEYSLLSTIIGNGYFHFNLFEDIYMFFYTYGIIFLCLIICLSFKKFRKVLYNRFNLIHNTDDFVLFSMILSIFIFSLIGGSDSDRFLLWGFPFYFVIGLLSLEIILENIYNNKSKKLFIIILLISGILWTRLLLPAIPNLIFTNGFNSVAHVKTNLNPNLFIGPKILTQYRNKLIKIKYDTAFENIHIGNYNKLSDAYIAINDTNKYSLITPYTPYTGAYKYSINNFPFPLGFLHNQYELLVIHPYAGGKYFKIILLIQWFLIYFLLYFLLLFNLNKRKYD